MYVKDHFIYFARLKVVPVNHYIMQTKNNKNEVYVIKTAEKERRERGEREGGERERECDAFQSVDGVRQIRKVLTKRDRNMFVPNQK